jgi:hypothetical protein
VLVNIRNPNNKTVRSTIKYTNHYQCEEKKTGDVWFKEVDGEKGPKCAKYLLPRIEGVEIMLSLSNMQYSTMNATAVVGDSIIPLQSSYSLINKREVEAGCKQSKSC